MQKRFGYLFLCLLIASCAQVPENNSRKTNSVIKKDDQLTLTRKLENSVSKSSRISTSELQLLLKNGYAFGVWGEDCKNPDGYFGVYYERDGRFVHDMVKNNEILRRAFIYDVVQITPGVLDIKMHAISFINGDEFIGKYRSGYAKETRLLFDGTRQDLVNGKLGEEILLYKDGYSYRKENGKYSKSDPVKKIVKCY